MDDDIPGVDRTLWLRLLGRELRDAGCIETAAALEKEAQIQIQSDRATQFMRELGEHAYEDAIESAMYMEMPSEALTWILRRWMRHLAAACSTTTTDRIMLVRTFVGKLSLDLSAATDLVNFVLWPTVDAARGRAALENDDFDITRYISTQHWIPQGSLRAMLTQPRQNRPPPPPSPPATTQENTFTCHHVLQEHKNEVWEVKLNHAGTHLASACKDGLLILWDLTLPTPTPRHLHVAFPNAVHHLAWSHDDAYLLGCVDNSVVLWQPTTGTHAGAEFDSHTNVVSATAWLPNNRDAFVSGGIDKQLILWVRNRATGVRDYVWHGHRIQDLVVVGPDVFAIVLPSAIRKFSLEHDHTDTLVWDATPSPLTSMSLSPHHPHVVLVQVLGKGLLLCLDLDTAIVTSSYKGHKHARYLVKSCFGPQATLVSGSEDAIVYVWHTDAPSSPLRLRGHSGVVNAVHSMGPWIASSSDDRTIRLWSTAELPRP
ncbi:Aste57867_24184 [Aphanomyces stellatus]|uniref:Aste57867_24184 protein n=1 Tax=Aphanomyces stellatus TaxID=120398 RepID=A0A485LQU7_9STRA|nr:hypothetical protein As57867_024110 [Aphanomyces stellatus]VFU00826.1 Aste57867_24184 [Aphanomyces stellatus]